MWVRNQLDFLGGKRASVAGDVVRPGTTAEVADVVGKAVAAGRVIVPLGAGSGVCGGVHAGAEATILDLKQLTDVRIEPELGIATFGAGVLGRLAEEACNRVGYTIGHFPSSIACSTVGGWVAARGAGQLSSRYGKMEDICVGATAVLADGSVHTAWRGSQELSEWIGNEGTLAVITEVVLVIRPLRQGWTFTGFMARDLTTALSFARQAVRQRPVPSLLRVYDPIDSRIALSHSKGRLAKQLPYMLAMPQLTRIAGDAVLRKCLVVVGWEGEGPEWQAAKTATAAIGTALGLKDMGSGPGELWLARRHDVSFKQITVLRSGRFADTFEVACPWTRVVPVYHAVRKAIAVQSVSMAHFSHAYSEGSAIYFSMAGPTDAYEETWERALAAANAAGATISHHHGVGRLKAEWLAKELGGAHGALCAAKTEHDPNGLLNPGCLALPCEPVAAPPHDTFAGVDRANGMWHGSVDEPLGALELKIRRFGWTLGAPPSPSMSVGEWLNGDLVGVQASATGSARDRIVALSGTLTDGTPFSTRAAPRSATGPDLRARLLRDAHVTDATLRLLRLPLRLLCLVHEGDGMLDLARRTALGDIDLWASAAQPKQVVLWLPYDTPAERMRADALDWPGRASEIDVDAAALPGTQLRQAPLRWRPWAQLHGMSVVGIGPAGAWPVDGDT